MERTSDYPCFNDFLMGRPCAPILSACGLKLGAKLLLGPSCAVLEPSWAEIRAKWAQVGPKLLPNENHPFGVDPEHASPPPS